MTVLDTENQSLANALERARAFLALHPHQRAADGWYRYLHEDRDSRTFFDAKPFRRTTMFSVRVAEEVAKAYLACANVPEERIAPTGSQVRAIQDTASALEAELDLAGPWLIADGRSRAFRDPLRLLRAAPSRVPPRTAGRLPLGKRRAFVLRLAESLYALDAGFPTKFLMVATVLAWEETSDRTIRDILTSDMKAAIEARVATGRADRIASENVAHHLISRVSVNPASDAAGVIDNRSDGDKVTDALRLLETLTDRTAATVMIDALTGLADEFGIERRSHA
ncbi:hypothetical protein [Burkholderia ambifaria]|uniref:hypothetical protein n=1 Tax=Burkholderia ambifaria TaxID=152480 RepID=UPI001B90C3E8|nr:hypothetical protein [Burkholderia ambifaria]MBR8256325.1 hypothetical protein [Burkholderia ambifaria]